MPFHLILLAFLLTPALLSCSQDAVPPKAKATKDKAAHLVETMPVVTKDLGYSSLRTGTLRARREVRIVNQEEGRLKELPYYEGDRVHRGDVLLRIDDTLLRAELAKATASRKQAAVDLERLKKLSRDRLIPEEEIARAQTALEVAQAEETLLQTRLGYTEVRAPFEGVVSARLVEPGDVLPRFSHVLTLIDPAQLTTEVPVSELLLPHLSGGDPVKVQIDALGATPYTGHIQRIHPSVNPDTRQGIVEITIEPVPPGARPGQLCRITLKSHPALRRLIPFDALRRDSNGAFVFRVGKDGKARRVGVSTGLQLGEQIEILEGVKENDRVVVKGFLGLGDDMAVREASASRPEAGSQASQ